MASPIPVGSATTQINSTANTTCNPAIPSGLTNGQHWMLLVVMINGNKTTSINTPAGWTALTGSPFLNSLSTGTLAVYTKLFATGDTAPSVTWTTVNKNVGFIQAYQNADLVTLLDVTVSSATGSSTTPTSPSVAAVTRGATRLHIHGTIAGANATPSWDCVERVDLTTSVGSPAAAVLMDQVGMAEGATGTRTATAGSASWVALTLWLRPAVATSFGLLQSARATSTVATSTTLTATYPNALTTGTGLTAEAMADATTVSAVSYPTSLAFTKAAERAGATQDMTIWHYQNNTSTSAAVVTMTTAAAGNMALLIKEWRGLATTGSILDQPGSATATGTAISVASTAATSSGSRLAIMAASPVATQTSMTASTSYTQRWAQISATNMASFSEDREFTGGGTETATATLSTSSEWEAALVVLLPPSSGTTVALTGISPGRGVASTGLARAAGQATARPPRRGAASTATPSALGTARPAPRPTSAARPSPQGQGRTAPRVPSSIRPAVFVFVRPALRASGTAGPPALTGRTAPALRAKGTWTPLAAGRAPVTSRAQGTLGAAVATVALVGRGAGQILAKGLLGPAPTARGPVSLRGQGNPKPSRLQASAPLAIQLRGAASPRPSGRAPDMPGARGTLGTVVATVTLVGRGAGQIVAKGLLRPGSTARGPVSPRGAASASPAGLQGRAPGRTQGLAGPRPRATGQAPSRGGARATLQTTLSTVALVGRGAGSVLAKGLLHLSAVGRAPSPRHDVSGLGTPRAQGVAPSRPQVRLAPRASSSGQAPGRSRSGATLRPLTLLARAPGVARVLGLLAGARRRGHLRLRDGVAQGIALSTRRTQGGQTADRAAGDLSAQDKEP